MCTSTWPNSACQDVKVDGPGVVHVERDGLSVGDHQPGVADGTVGRGAQRDDHHVEVALGAADAVLHRVGGLEEPVEAQRLQLAAQVRHRVVGQQHHGVLVDVRAQEGRIEVVLVQVADVEVVAVAERVPVQLAVVREREPRREVRRVDPRVAEDAAGRGVDPETGVSDACDLHELPSWGVLSGYEFSRCARCVPFRRAGGTRLGRVEPVYGTVIKPARAGVAAAGVEVHRHRRREPARDRRRGDRDQPHQLLRLHLRRTARLPAGARPQGALHGQAGGLRLQGQRPHHAQPAPHPGGPRQRRRIVRRGVPAAQGGRAGRRLPRGDDQPQLRDQGVQVRCGAHGDRRRRADRPAHRLGRPAGLDQGPPPQHAAAQGADLDRRR